MGVKHLNTFTLFQVHAFVKAFLARPLLGALTSAAIARKFRAARHYPTEVLRSLNTTEKIAFGIRAYGSLEQTLGAPENETHCVQLH